MIYTIIHPTRGVFAIETDAKRHYGLSREEIYVSGRITMGSAKAARTGFPPDIVGDDIQITRIALRDYSTETLQLSTTTGKYTLRTVTGRRDVHVGVPRSIPPSSITKAPALVYRDRWITIAEADRIVASEDAGGES